MRDPKLSRAVAQLQTAGLLTVDRKHDKRGLKTHNSYLLTHPLDVDQDRTSCCNHADMDVPPSETSGVAMVRTQNTTKKDTTKGTSLSSGEFGVSPPSTSNGGRDDGDRLAKHRTEIQYMRERMKTILAPDQEITPCPKP